MAGAAPGLATVRSEYIRATQPLVPPSPKIPLLGTTWYRCGPGYWARRGTIVTGVLLLVDIIFASGSAGRIRAASPDEWAGTRSPVVTHAR